MFCGKCGTNNPDGNVYCCKCGSKIAEKVMAEASEGVVNITEEPTIAANPEIVETKKKKKKPLYKRWWFWLIIIILLFMIFGGKGEKNNQTPATAAKDQVVNDNRDSADSQLKPQKKNNTESVKKEEPVVAEIKDSDFTSKGYLYENSIGTTYYYVVVTNNGKATVEVNGNAIAMDSSGATIGADDMSIDILGPGETSIGYFFFDNVKNVASVDYQLSYSEEKYFAPVIGNLSLEQNLNDKNLTLTVTNNGNTVAQFVEANALFFDSNDNVIQFDSRYVVDNESEIKPGSTISVQLDSYKGYDHVEVYLTGRSDGVVVDSSNASNSSDKLLEDKGYIYENSIGTTYYYVVVKNISKDTFEVGGNATAKDAAGNVIGAGSLSIDVLGPGETSIGYFFFDNVKNVASVDYQLTTGESYYTAVLANIALEQNINNKNVVVTVTNNGKESAEFLEAHALFFDANNNVVGYDSKYLVDNDSEIKPGATLSGQLDSYKEFDHVEVYLTGRKY